MPHTNPGSITETPMTTTAPMMTIGRLSRRTGVSVKTLREYERLGFIYTQGRSAGNYRLFAEEAVWCVQATQGLRSLGLTLKQIQELAASYLAYPGDTINPLLDERLTQAASRVESQIADLQDLRQRIRDFQGVMAGKSSPNSLVALAHLLTLDPRRASAFARP